RRAIERWCRGRVRQRARDAIPCDEPEVDVLVAGVIEWVANRAVTAFLLIEVVFLIHIGSGSVERGRTGLEAYVRPEPALFPGICQKRMDVGSAARGRELEVDVDRERGVTAPIAKMPDDGTGEGVHLLRAGCREGDRLQQRGLGGSVLADQHRPHSR